MTQLELAQDSGYSLSVITQVETGKRKLAAKTARAVLETLGRRAPISEVDAHDFLVGNEVMEPAGGFIGAAMHAEFLRKGILQSAAADDAPSRLPAHIEQMCLKAIELMGMERFVTVLQTMVAVSAADQHLPQTFNVRRPPIQREGYTEEVISTYERVSPPGGASSASRKPAAGE